MILYPPHPTPQPDMQGWLMLFACSFSILTGLLQRSPLHPLCETYDAVLQQEQPCANSQSPRMTMFFQGSLWLTLPPIILLSCPFLLVLHPANILYLWPTDCSTDFHNGLSLNCFAVWSIQSRSICRGSFRGWSLHSVLIELGRYFLFVSFPGSPV